MNITFPMNLPLLRWADAVVNDLEEFGAFGRLDAPDDWQQWGVQFCTAASIDKNLPNPYQFHNWRSWADRLCEQLS